MKLTHLLIVPTSVFGILLANADDKAFGDGTLPEFLQQYDVNEDGQIDEEERQAIREARQAAREARRAEIDTDGDGVISDEEREAARDEIRAKISEKRAEKFAEIAGDDGELSLEELGAVPHLSEASADRIASLFARLDSDESGAVSLEEFTARLRDHQAPKRPRPTIADLPAISELPNIEELPNIGELPNIFPPRPGMGGQPQGGAAMTRPAGAPQPLR